MTEAFTGGSAAPTNLKRSQEVLDDDPKPLQQNKNARLASSNLGSAPEPQLPDLKNIDEEISDNSGAGEKVHDPELEMRGTPQASQPRSKNKHVSRREAGEFAKSRKTKEKGRKTTGRKGGSRNETTSVLTQEGEAVPGSSAISPGKQDLKAPRLPKRQCALLIGFCGTGCNGMQIQTNVQPPIRTVEGVLFESLVKAGAVSQDNADDPVKVNLGRAARTDAGVHAAGNVVSIKMITNVPDVSDLVSRINEELPPEIRLWGFVRVQNSFNARLSCDSRKYTYFFPTYLLIPPKPGSAFHRTLQRYAASGSPVSPAPEDNPLAVHPFWAETDPEVSTREDDLFRKRNWRIDPGHLDDLRQTATKFEGTHNFHNFTVGRDFSDRSAQRHIKKVEISEPAVYGNTEWISVMFHGQSFMLHQRKMMCALVLSCRTGTPSQVINELYGPRVVFVPRLPSLGLLLEHPIFDSYNKKVSSINEKLDPTDPDYRPPIDFEVFRYSIDEFKQKYIYDNMRSTEDRDGVFDAWVRSVDAYSGNDMLYLNPKGVIPAMAIVEKGVRRDNPFKEKKRFDATSFPAAVPGQLKEEEEEEEEEELLDKAHLADTEG